MAVQTYTRNVNPSQYALPYIQDTLAGNYLPGGPNANPYLDRTFDMAALRTQNQLASEFAGAGRNVEASQPLRAQQLGDLATQIYGGAYDAERNRQQGVLPYAGSETVSTSPLHRDRVGELLGGLMLGGELLGDYGDLWDRFFGDEAGGGASGDGQPSIAGDAGSAASDALGSGVGSMGGRILGGGPSTPAGTVTVTDSAGNVVSGAAGAGAAGSGLSALVSGMQPAIQTGIGATAAATEASLLASQMPTLAPIAESALGGGAGAAGTSALGLGASLGLAALPMIFAATTPFGDEIHDESSQAARATQGLGLGSPANTQWGQTLLGLPDGTYIDYKSVRRELGNRYGKEPNESVLAWLMTHPRVQYSVPHLGRRRGPNAPPQDYR